MQSMSILDKIRPKKQNLPTHEGYKTFTAYTPNFTTYDGGVYGQELTRSAIERFAVTVSKLKPEYDGTAHPAMKRAFDTQPNEFMTWPKFLSVAATMTECDNTAAIVPVYAPDLRTKVGLFPLHFQTAEVIEYDNEPWIRFYTPNGTVYCIELSEVCLLTRFQYTSEFFGEHGALDSTMQLIHAQDEAQEAAIKNGAVIRFIGAVDGMVSPKNISEKREKFVADNLTTSNTSGLMVYDNTFRDIKQVDPTAYTMDASEMERINQSVYNYFGINQDILQNSYTEDTWGAWYEGKIEPFALQLGEGLSSMVFTQRERQTNRISFSSNRLEYASNASKRNMIKDMMDRGVLTINQALDILQLPGIGPEGDIRVIRGEYMNASSVEKAVTSYADGDTGDSTGEGDEGSLHDTEKDANGSDTEGADDEAE